MSWDRFHSRRFVCLWHFNSWGFINFGISIDIWSPNIEIHLPGGFVRVGWWGVSNRNSSYNRRKWNDTTYGIDYETGKKSST